MKRFRSIIAGLLVVSALGAIALAPAGAEEPKKCGVSSPTHWAYCYGSNNEEIGGTTQKASGTGGTGKLAANLNGAEAKFECSSTKITEELEAGGKAKGTMKLLGCKETKPANCVLTEAEEREIKLPFTGSLTGKLETPGNPEAIMAGTGAGEEVGIIYIEHAGECSIPAGGYTVTGKQYVEVKKPEEALAEHEQVATKLNSDFKVGENSASLEGTDKVRLTGSHEGASWYIGEGD
jgi:hypothetical protein